MKQENRIIRDEKGRFVKGKMSGENNPFYGKKHVAETREKMKIVREELFKSGKINQKGALNNFYRKKRDDNWKKEHSERMKQKYGEGYINPMKGQSPWNKNMKGKYKIWEDKPTKNKERIRKIIQGLMKRPTSFERKISELCIENSLPFIYTGNGRFLINFKNPDFVNEQDKVVIEVFYSWFKIRDYGSVENYKEFCRKKYNSAGWRVIFIDEREIDIDNWKELCLNKILGLK